MILEVDLTRPRGAIQLVEANHLDSFRVRALVQGEGPDWAALRSRLATSAGIDEDSGDAFVAISLIERLAGDVPSFERWRTAFHRMLDAEGPGWRGTSGAVAAPVEWETLAEVSSQTFRQVLGHFPTGVAVVTANRPGGPVGMACNSFTAVSLDPPLIALCPAKTSETWPELRDSGRFVVNVMGSSHELLVRQFASKDTDRFASVEHREQPCGPALAEALAWIECVLVAEHDAGDHTIALGRVIRLEAAPDIDPLVFFRGAYGTFLSAVV